MLGIQKSVPGRDETKLLFLRTNPEQVNLVWLPRKRIDSADALSELDDPPSKLSLVGLLGRAGPRRGPQLQRADTTMETERTSPPICKCTGRRGLGRKRGMSSILSLFSDACSS
jgi:hypothetical protein|uniref:Uncharacterized protein n=1 Tax=Picea glauca TaxID=3330 RepID=A0A101LYH9_PICGL|nr:hypothetical protein ABT39_MTgene5814 [Picea glauca]QHR92294.1 hypothetical protein Q903MT_gene6336 [Picea sitchensis]